MKRSQKAIALQKQANQVIILVP